MLSAILNANVEIKQNIKALYKNVKLTEDQKDFIFDNQEDMKNIIYKIANQKLKKNKKGTMNEKNVIEFTLTPKGEVSDFKYLKRSNKRKYDKQVKEIIVASAKKFPKPTVATPMRYIIKYNNMPKQTIQKVETTEIDQKPRYQRIPLGTSRFLYSSKEYVRVFKVSKDGYINISNEMCANVTILTIQNQRIRTGPMWWRINEPIKKGNYKMLIKAKKKCDLNVQYP